VSSWCLLSASGWHSQRTPFVAEWIWLSSGKHMAIDSL
jgi:hypothetical protein